MNPAADRLLSDAEVGTRCCDLLGCGTAAAGGRCLVDLARARGAPLPEVRIDLPRAHPVGAAWLTASPMGDGASVLIELRPGDLHDRRRRTTPHWDSDRYVHVHTFGKTRVEGREGPIAGDWLDQRPGQILKLLLCNRGSVVQSDAIAEAIWPRGGPSAVTSVRYFVHTLRHHLEPDLAKREPSSFVVARRGGYMLDPATVHVDADLFERRVRHGLSALEQGRGADGVRDLEAAMALYTGDFLGDEPYAQWALGERDRIRRLASEALEALAAESLRQRRLEDATRQVERMAELMPYDVGVHRRLTAMLIVAGRRSEAVRAYDTLRERLRSMFEEEPGFSLADVSADEAFEA